MSRDLSLYLDDILVSIDKIQRYTANLMRSEFIADERTFDAVIRNLEIIGEAVKNIPPTVRVRVAWRSLISTLRLNGGKLPDCGIFSSTPTFPLMMKFSGISSKIN